MTIEIPDSNKEISSTGLIYLKRGLSSDKVIFTTNDNQNFTYQIKKVDNQNTMESDLLQYDWFDPEDSWDDIRGVYDSNEKYTILKIILPKELSRVVSEIGIYEGENKNITITGINFQASRYVIITVFSIVDDDTGTLTVNDAVLSFHIDDGYGSHKDDVRGTMYNLREYSYVTKATGEALFGRYSAVTASSHIIAPDGSEYYIGKLLRQV